LLFFHGDPAGVTRLGFVGFAPLVVDVTKAREWAGKLIVVCSVQDSIRVQDKSTKTKRVITFCMGGFVLG
jgi:hypothetical protein